MSAPAPLSIALVEDNPSVRTSLAAVLRDSPLCRRVETCANGTEALRVIPALTPDVVIMDIELPDISGVECTAQLKRLLPELPILILTVYNDNEQIFRALEAGASGYLLKRATPDEIVQAVEEVWNGGAPMSAEIARKVVRSFHKVPAPGPAAHPLTRRETEILDFLTQGYTSKEIAERLAISYDTVCEHLGNVYRKLHVRSRAEAVATYLKGTTPRPRS